MTATKSAALLSVALVAWTLAAQTPEEHPANAGKKLDVHIKIKAPNGKATSGNIDVKGAEDTCTSLSQGRSFHGGDARFEDLPACLVRFDVVVTGFNVNRVKVDLRNYKDPLEIRIAKDGKAAASMGSGTTENADAGTPANPSH